MTRRNSFKRLVRTRMAKTGESYTAARAVVLAASGDGGAPALTMSDDSIRRRTGRGWEEWFDRLDEWGAVDRPHKEVARWLREDEGLPGWDAQSVTVSYERARGRRAERERPDGFSVTAQKTVAVPVERLYDAFVDPAVRERWLPGASMRERTATRPKTARYDWGDGDTRVVVGFMARGPAKATVALEHERLPDSGQADRMKAFWRERLAALAVMVSGDGALATSGSRGRTRTAPAPITSPDGTPIAFERAGNGPALILVDGALCFRGFGPMARLAELLAPDFAVYRYDRRGRGASGDTGPYAVERELEDLDAVIAAAGGSACVFGLSSGAVLALRAAASGSAISRLALYEPPLTVTAEEPDGFAERIAELIAAGRRGDAVAFFFSASGVPEEAIAAMREEPSWPLFESVAPTLVYDNAVLGDGAVPREPAAAITVPTLVANGGESPDFFRAAAEATAAAIPNATHRTLAHQSWGQVVPEALAPMLRRFFLER